MAQKSQGMRNKTRQKLSKDSGEKDTITNHLKEFDEGQTVVIKTDPAIHRGLPQPQFHGKTGTIAGRQGRAYQVAVQDGGKQKELLIYPAHLKEA